MYLIGNIGAFVKHWFWDEFTVGEEELSCGGRRNAVVVMSGSASNIWTISSVKRMFISVEERCF